jgi:Ni2+-binding GTPase involved in maturation of urease and hydrogenase
MTVESDEQLERLRAAGHVCAVARDTMASALRPGITTADLLIINKTDLAPHVGADLGTMATDAKRQRGDLPVIFTSLTTTDGIRDVADWVTCHLNKWRTGATA